MGHVGSRRSGHLILAGKVGRPSNLVTDGSAVFVAAGAGLEAFNGACASNGQLCRPMWVDRLPVPIQQPPILADGIIYVGAGGVVYGFPATCDGPSCAAVRSMRFKGDSISSFAIVGDLVVAGRSSGGIEAVRVVAVGNRIVLPVEQVIPQEAAVPSGVLGGDRQFEKEPRVRVLAHDRHADGEPQWHVAAGTLAATRVALFGSHPADTPPERVTGALSRPRPPRWQPTSNSSLSLGQKCYRDSRMQSSPPRR